jgi:hypothetical protein
MPNQDERRKNNGMNKEDSVLSLEFNEKQSPQDDDDDVIVSKPVKVARVDP